MKKNYKDCIMKNIGCSDIASLTVREPGKAHVLNFGEDGLYSAYIADENTIIGEHYNKVLTCRSWINIYDDEGLTFKAYGKEINIYRAGDFGCLIQIIKESEDSDEQIRTN